MASVAKTHGTVKLPDEGLEVLKCIYDFSVDGGAAGALTLFTAGQDMVVHKCIMKVQTACTSGGSATVAVCSDGAGAEYCAATAVASLTANAIIGGVPSTGGVRLASGSTCDILIETAALTAGKIEVELFLSKF